MPSEQEAIELKALNRKKAEEEARALQRNAMLREEAAKKSALQSMATRNDAGEFQGYEFQQDSMANKLAYLFGGEKGEAKAKEILDKAKKIPDSKERQDYIAKEVDKKAKEVDSGFQQGLGDIFKGLQGLGKPAQGDEAGKEAAVSLMQGLGLNINPDNAQTHYEPGPPQVFMVSWVNRPTDNLKQADSHINQLADAYRETLSAEKSQDFDSAWQTHRTHAEAGGPKIDKAEFEAASSKKFKEVVADAKQTCKAQSSQMASLKDKLKQAHAVGSSVQQEHGLKAGEQREAPTMRM